MTAPCKQMQVIENCYAGRSKGTTADDPECEQPGLTYMMERFSSATNLFGFVRLSEVVVERGDIRMHV
jgi:hypothetical protein